MVTKSLDLLEMFCSRIPERCVGSEGNRQATRFFESELSSLGWETELEEFDAIDWHDEGAVLLHDKNSFEVFVSPYSLGFKGEAVMAAAKNISELKKINASGKILLLYGEIAREQLMPKNFIFYNPDEHREIVAMLENSGALALICATGRNASLAGGVYPFPLIEDGDFNIPSVYMTEDEGIKLLPFIGQPVFLESISKRVPGKGCNVIGRMGRKDLKKIVITAHIDAKKGTPGAIDNATGVIILLLVAKLLKDFHGNQHLEIVALNGEDYYAVPGQMTYIQNNHKSFKNTILNINIDGAGYKVGPSAFSFFNLPENIRMVANETLQQFEQITEGIQWPQGDHSIFLQHGIPAIAVSSKWFIDNINTQDITHTSKDNIGIVDADRLVEIANALNFFIRKL